MGRRDGRARSGGYAEIMSIASSILAALSYVVAEPDVVIADFEGATYGEWAVSGNAFGTGPARGTLPNQMTVSGFEGAGLANSFRGGDGATGRLVSPEFSISRGAITFLIGGGGWAGKTCMNLLVDGKVVRSATGPNTQEGGSEALERMNWDVPEFVGAKARIEIMDDATGGWGHINVDQIVMTDHPPAGVVEHPSARLVVEKQYLNLPIRNDAPVRRLALVVDGSVVNDFEAEITEKEPDFWAFVDVSAWKGRRVELRADRLPAGGAALEKAEQSDEPKGAEPLYGEKLRPQFHFSTRRGWINDPNGMVYSNGEYHLYYQHNPFGWAARNMHWGHAVSRDLLHWTELPTALAPRSFGDWVWSGSAVVDAENTSGWRRGNEETIVAAFTSTARGECVAYSNDRGRTFTEFEGNPVVRHAKGEGRDPRLLWYGPKGSGGHWVMAVYDEDRELPEPDRRGVAFYTSSDLKRWTFRSRIGGFYECPDMFELPVDGGKNGTKWVLTAASSEYLLGQFDGATFTPDAPAEKLPGNRGDRFYAAQTFSQTPDGRRIQIGWGQIETRGMPFNQMMSFPCELTLRTTPEGVRLFSWPVKEIESLYGKAWRMESAEITAGKPVRSEGMGALLDVSATIEPRTAAAVDLVVRGRPVRLDMGAGRVSCGDRSAALTIRDGRVPVRVLADRTSIELFVNGGEIAMLVSGDFRDEGVVLMAERGTARVVEFTVNELRSAWGAER